VQDFPSAFRDEDDVVLTLPLRMVKALIVLHRTSLSWCFDRLAEGKVLFDRPKCQTAGASPAKPGELPIGLVCELQSRRCFGASIAFDEIDARQPLPWISFTPMENVELVSQNGTSYTVKWGSRVYTFNASSKTIRYSEPGHSGVGV